MQQQLFQFDRPLPDRFVRWWGFHADHPHVFDLFVRYALTAKRNDRKVGARCIWERMRWELQVEASGEPYKLNDHYPPYYARLAMQVEAELEGFFEVRGKPDVDDSQILAAHQELIA